MLRGAGAVGGMLAIGAARPASADAGRPPVRDPGGTVPAGPPAGRIVAWGTTLDPVAQTARSRALARRLTNPQSPSWRARGDQRRTYRFPDAQADVAYRISVPTGWDGRSPLPTLMFLHGAGVDENYYLDMNAKQLVTLAAERGYLLVAPTGYQGAYGSLLRLGSAFGQQAAAEKVIAARTEADEHTQQLSEQDVLNVLELVRAEYPVDPGATFLAGHSMGSGGTWYLGGKYPHNWRAIAPMSGPFVQENGYPWASLRSTPILVTEGLDTPSLSASRLLRDWLASNGFRSTYLEVAADHIGMVRLTLPAVFDFFDRARRP